MEEKTKDADVIVANKVPICESTIGKAQNLKLVCLTATGFNNLDGDYLKKRGIAAYNVAGYSTNGVAQHTFALLFYVLEKLNYYDNYVKSGAYARGTCFSHFGQNFFELDGKTWGIIGLGAIGNRVAQIAKAFGCHIICYSASGKKYNTEYEQVSLDELLSRSDILSVHAPLNGYTENLMTLEKFRKMKNQGVVAVFKRDRFDRYSNFARIGDGSLGGKGRGLAFIDNMVKHHPEFEEFDNARVAIPKTVVLCTDVFDEFMETNNLYQVALSDAEDDVILRYFLKAKLPDRLVEDFFTFFDVVKSPLAIRSSSLLEDSHYQPFAGIYNTYMIPYLDDKYEMLRMLSDAIKGVYASVYFRDSKAYMQATSNVIDQEKMAVILQEVVGNQYGDRYYPSMSGVARSLNYYPIGDEKAEEGTVNLALGLGKYIVDGGMTLRFSPYHPHQILQTSEMEIALKETQTRFYALDLKNAGHDFSIDDGFNLLKLHVKEAENDGALRYIASTYDPYDQVIRDGLYPGGRKVITFANILQHDVFPLPRILQLVLKYGEQEMRRPVEIEFAATMSREQDKTGTFYLLQIRPIVDSKEMLDEDLNEIRDEDVILRSYNSLGHGIMNEIHDIVYVKTEGYSASNNQAIAWEIEKINRQFLNEGKNYVLVGPGRWGSSDTWLGIPVKWPHISAARVIVEAGLTNYRVDPSQGTHFFQNLTSFGVGYFTINAFMNDGVYDQDFLNAQPAVGETKFLRHVRFEKPMIVKMDGKKKLGVVLRPED